MKKITHGKTSKILMLDGETLFEQGDEGDLAYMIVHGTLDVFVDGKKVGSMRDGEVFGEMALLSRVSACQEGVFPERGGPGLFCRHRARGAGTDRAIARLRY